MKSVQTHGCSGCYSIERRTSERSAINWALIPLPVRLGEQCGRETRRGNREDVRAEDKERGFQVLFSGHNTATERLILQWLWLPTVDLHMTGHVSCQSGVGGIHRVPLLLAELLMTAGFQGKNGQCFQCAPNDESSNGQFRTTDSSKPLATLTVLAKN